MSVHGKKLGWLLAGLAAAALGVVCCLPRFTDPAAYFDFADQRKIWGIPHFMDVISNVPFAAVGIIGLVSISRAGRGSSAVPPCEPWERRAFVTLFAGLLLVAGGSAYFHLSPSPASLFWDRLPMTIVFMSFFALAVGDRIDARAGRILFAPLLAVGIGSVLYWRYTVYAGSGDLRFYLLVQFFPMLALPILTFSPARYSCKYDLAVVVGIYAVAKLLEILDAPIFAITGSISGHALKHLAAALAAAWMLRMARRWRLADSGGL